MPYTTKREITISLDTDSLESYHDGFLAQLWHVAQANPAEHGDRDAGETAEMIGREIIRRWLKHAPVELWRHQGRDYARNILTNHGHFSGPAHDTSWVYGKSEDNAADVGARAAAAFTAATVPSAPA